MSPTLQNYVHLEKLLIQSTAKGTVQEVSRLQTEMRVVRLALSKEERRLLLKSDKHFIAGID